MTFPMPEGDALRKAVKWISERREEKPDMAVTKLIEEACRVFDLCPKDCTWLFDFFARS